VVAVDNLSLAISRGSIYGLLGPNGAGKTTALRIIVGILMPDEGAVRIFGEPFERRHLKTAASTEKPRSLSYYSTWASLRESLALLSRAGS